MQANTPCAEQEFEMMVKEVNGVCNFLKDRTKDKSEETDSLCSKIFG